MTILSIGALSGTALLGFCAGLFSFKIKSRWCPRCGAPTFPHEPTNREGAR